MLLEHGLLQPEAISLSLGWQLDHQPELANEAVCYGCHLDTKQQNWIENDFEAMHVLFKWVM